MHKPELSEFTYNFTMDITTSIWGGQKLCFECHSYTKKGDQQDYSSLGVKPASILIMQGCCGHWSDLQIQNVINKTACNHDGDTAQIEAAKVREDLKIKAANTGALQTSWSLTRYCPPLFVEASPQEPIFHHWSDYQWYLEDNWWQDHLIHTLGDRPLH